MSAQRVLYALLSLVAAAAAVLSFSALRDLAAVCGFHARLAWLLPVTIDLGATAGAVAWLARRANPAGQSFGRALALVLLAASVAGNALGHGLDAYRLAPPWWVVVIVSAVAPTVLGATVHLAVLLTRAPAAEPLDPSSWTLAAVPDGGPGWFEATTEPEPDEDRAAALIESGAGRRRIARELGISEHQARLMIERRTS